ncbi:sulfate/molybdate ABC transporter ATP-binding protein [Solimonas terrae]|uniref:Sulfate/molybdate ABC transporter ATP-binding protein n=1 Tax=Solimonas terrae TaxID=1396819 RepID=A0A6M2BSL8_9GAMM|nr:sulfate/molybdate ABC transporter ATP-binding protein [Solimonas terrae]NGY05320.1 sulfate/molybdate ABC transporter ATP-binding protein [Solimonas terrae]
MDIRIRGIHKSFGSFAALAGVDLDIHSGELIALLGPSGSGKTTLLRSIAGLEFPDAGAIFFGEENIAGRPIRERRVGFVFQHYALFKHMNVLDNVAFGLRVRERGERPPEPLIRERARELIDLVQLGGLETRYPSQLSGGQRQRVALARALAIEPRVLLLDEPFGALDAKVRKDLRRWLRQLHDKTGYTTIFVTHDQEEALELADRVVVMNRGRIEQFGTTDEVYEQPATPFVFDFLGNTNVLSGEVRGRELFVDGQTVPIVTDTIHAAGPVDVYVRPGDLRIADAATPGFDATIHGTQRTGPILRCTAVTAGTGRAIEIEVPHLHYDTQALRAGQSVRLRLGQFSVFARSDAVAGATPRDAPLLIGSERQRSRLG